MRKAKVFKSIYGRIGNLLYAKIDEAFALFESGGSRYDD